MKERIVGIKELAKKKGMKIVDPKEKYLKECEMWREQEFIKEHEFRELGNKKWRAWKLYDKLCKDFARFEKELQSIKQKRYETYCKYKGVRPVLDEEQMDKKRRK
jgi:hypothetical protein